MDLPVADLTEDQVKELSARLQAIHTADADLANAVQVISVKVPSVEAIRTSKPARSALPLAVGTTSITRPTLAAAAPQPPAPLATWPTA